MVGVYAITNLVTGRVYIGSSVDIPRRWKEHLLKLSHRVHPNTALQSDWMQYGAASFSWTVSAECESRAAAITAEQQHIDSTADLYNASRRAGSGHRDGFRHTDAARLKMSQALLGRPKSDAHKANISAAKRGKPCPAQAAALRGRTHSPEHCEAIRIAHLGKQHTPETKAKISAALIGRDTSAWSAKMAATKTGRPWSQKRREMWAASKAVSLMESEG